MLYYLTFSESLATKCMFLNNEKCMIRLSSIDLNPVELNYYSFMIGIDKCNGKYNAVDDLSTKICFPNEAEDLNVKRFTMIARIKEAKTFVKHISRDCKGKFNSRVCILNQKWNNCKRQCDCKNYRMCIKNYSWNPSTRICEDGKYLKSIADTSVIGCNEIRNVMDSASVTNIISTNVTSTVSTNSDNKKVKYRMDCYALHTVLLLIILLFINAIICYHCAKRRLKRKNIGTLTI